MKKQLRGIAVILFGILLAIVSVATEPFSTGEAYMIWSIAGGVCGIAGLLWYLQKNNRKTNSNLTKECDCMKKFRTVVSVIIMILCAVVGLFLGASLNNAIGGCILGVLISGIACIIYVLDNQDKN